MTSHFFSFKFLALLLSSFCILIIGCGEPNTNIKVISSDRPAHESKSIENESPADLKFSVDGIPVTVSSSPAHSLSEEEKKAFSQFEFSIENRERLVNRILTNDRLNAESFAKDMKSPTSNEQLIILKDIADSGWSEIGDIKMQLERAVFAVSGHAPYIKSEPTVSIAEFFTVGQSNGDVLTELLAMTVALDPKTDTANYYVVSTEGRSLLASINDVNGQKHLVATDTIFYGKARKDLGELQSLATSPIKAVSLNYYLYERSLAAEITNLDQVRLEMTKKAASQLKLNDFQESSQTNGPPSVSSFFPQIWILQLKEKDQSKVLYTLKTVDEVSTNLSSEKEGPWYESQIPLLMEASKTKPMPQQ